ncbi:RNA-directed DNA polymerase, eukaryota, reverse transcriptase zinc-binding domain protein [Tanacetum coccineum]
MASCEINYHCDKCALFFKKVDQYLKHVNDVHESVQHHDSFNYHDFVVAIDPYLLKSESTTTSPITPKPLESECTPSKPKEEDLFKLEITEEMIEVDQAIRSLKSPHWSPPVTFLDYSTDVFVLAPSPPSSN